MEANWKLFIGFFIAVPLTMFLLYMVSKIISTAIFNSYIEMKIRLNRILLDNIKEILKQQGGKEDGAK